ncbi:MAG: RelA/SpoT domain-containing protein [Chloroflexi bacterium]|nr:RelA/SpoT domain-containing protein [Chloroflexota bacterium]
MLEWARPAYSRTRVNAAGKALAHDESSCDAALNIMRNWRSSHSFPLNALQILTRERALKTDSNAIVAQRLKRQRSIVRKLQEQPKMNLSQMQDVGGCRAVVSTVDQVHELVDRFRTGKSKHELMTDRDYIYQPRASGYRSHHLVFKYYSDKSLSWNGLRIEVQIRSALQHVWATAVEIVDTFSGGGELKAGKGDERWQRFSP